VLEEMQHVVVELFRVLDERDVADVRLDQQPSAWDARRHELGVLALIASS